MLFKRKIREKVLFFKVYFVLKEKKSLVCKKLVKSE